MNRPHIRQMAICRTGLTAETYKARIGDRGRLPRNLPVRKAGPMNKVYNLVYTAEIGMDPTKSRIFVEHTPDVTIVTLHDERILHEEQIREIEKSVMVIVEQARRLNMALDFCNVKFLSSAFLGLLVKIHKKTCERKGHLRLCNVDPSIYKVFEITRLDKVFDISQKPR